MCDNKNEFKEFYPEEDKELETGKWYKTEDDSCLFYHRGGNSSYGFQKGVWTENWDTDLWSWRRDGLEVLRATVEYVESALIEEAKRIGFIKGVVFESLIYDAPTSTLSSNKLDWENTSEGWHLRDSDGESIFHNGQWATIIEQDKFTELKEAQYQNRGAILRTHTPLVNADEFNPSSEEELKEDEEILRRSEERAIEQDKINPHHYNSKGIQPIDYIEANNMNFNEGNVIKYVTRYKEKNGLEDLKKAKVYLQRLIDRYDF